VANLKEPLIVKITHSMVMDSIEKALFCQSEAVISLPGVSQTIAAVMRPLAPITQQTQALSAYGCSASFRRDEGM
jgi:hypothetical protein